MHFGSGVRRNSQRTRALRWGAHPDRRGRHKLHTYLHVFNVPLRIQHGRPKSKGAGHALNALYVGKPLHFGTLPSNLVNSVFQQLDKLRHNTNLDILAPTLRLIWRYIGRPTRGGRGRRRPVYDLQMWNVRDRTKEECREQISCMDGTRKFKSCFKDLISGNSCALWDKNEFYNMGTCPNSSYWISWEAK